MKFRTLIAIPLLLLSFAAAAQFTIVKKAHEVNLEDFRPPLTANGVVAFRACSDCEVQRVRVTPETLYKINGERVRLMDFRRTLAKVEKPEDAGVTVKHDFESDTIVSLDMWF